MFGHTLKRTPVRVCLWWFAFCAAGFILLFHYSLLFVYCMPANPIRSTFQPQITTYTSSFFTQDWQLFAPNPVSTNDILSVRATSAPKAQTGPYTAWVDLITPLIHTVQDNRFTEQQIPELMVSNATVAIVNGGALDPKSLFSQAVAKGNYPLDYIVLARYACHVLSDLYPQNHFTFIQLAITKQQPPDFSHATSDGYQITGNNIFPPVKYVVVS